MTWGQKEFAPLTNAVRSILGNEYVKSAMLRFLAI